MTPLEMIAKLCPLRSHATAKGCADAPPDNLEACPACAVAFIDIMERKLMRDTDELQQELEYERKLRQEAQDALIAVCQDTSEMNYEALLKKYMQHVGESEGSTFMHTIHDRTRSDVKFTEEEVAVLETMNREILG